MSEVVFARKSVCLVSELEILNYFLILKSKDTFGEKKSLES